MQALPLNNNNNNTSNNLIYVFKSLFMTVLHLMPLFPQLNYCIYFALWKKCLYCWGLTINPYSPFHYSLWFCPPTTNFLNHVCILETSSYWTQTGTVYNLICPILLFTLYLGPENHWGILKYALLLCSFKKYAGASVSWRNSHSVEFWWDIHPIQGLVNKVTLCSTHRSQEYSGLSEV